jgi:CheY-like chemotaxis protein
MAMSQPHELIAALATLAWPLLLAFLLWKLFPIVKEILQSRGFTIKIAGMEVSVQEAAQQLRTQIEDLQKHVIRLRSGEQPSGTSPEPGKLLSHGEPKKPPRILWVDDDPKGNVLQIAHLKDRGIDVVQAVSTNEAIAHLNSGMAFDAVISDMGRREGGVYNAHAGLAFLNEMKQVGHHVPFYVYTSPEAAAHSDKEVRAAGGDGATASAVELQEWINRKLKAE